jgi:predicted MPP superfamily phosphohydrolase
MTGISRRRFLAAAGALAASSVALDAFEIEPSRVLVSRHDVVVAGLPADLAGMRIAQISDLHLPGNRGAARATLEEVTRERPEIVVLTGDLIERRSALRQLTEFMGEVRAPLATVGVLGNWEDYSGATDSEIRVAYRKAGAELLVNQHTVVPAGGARLALVGVDDPVTGSPDLATARAGIPDGIEELLLVHAPGYVEPRPPGAETPPAMVLAGHTHGGQIRIPLLPAFTPTGSGRFVEGWYRDTFAPLYVSRGVGTVTLRARFRCPPELPIFTLRGA